MSIRKFTINPKELIRKIIDIVYTLIFKSNFIKKKIILSYNILTRKGWTPQDFLNHINIRFPLNSTSIKNEIVEKLKGKYNNYYFLCKDNFYLDEKIINLLKINKIKNLNDLSKKDIYNSFFFIVSHSDDLILEDIEKITDNHGFYKSLYASHSYSTNTFGCRTSYRFTNINCLKSLNNTFKNLDRISHFGMDSLTVHENICEALEITKDVEGDYVEVGVYKGGSALTALNYLHQINSKKKAYLLDTYEGFNYDESRKSSDIYWWSFDNHFLDKEEKMKSYLKETFKDFNNYKLIINNVCKDNLPEEINAISAANIDVDLYEATFEAIKKVSKKLSNKGIIMCEDPVYTPATYGAYYAMEKFLNSTEGKGFVKIFKKGHYFLMKLN